MTDKNINLFFVIICSFLAACELESGHHEWMFLLDLVAVVANMYAYWWKCKEEKKT